MMVFKVEILPGMVASVDVLAGKRTVLDYIWNPMMKVKGKSTYGLIVKCKKNIKIYFVLYQFFLFAATNLWSCEISSS